MKVGGISVDKPKLIIPRRTSGTKPVRKKRASIQPPGYRYLDTSWTTIGETNTSCTVMIRGLSQGLSVSVGAFPLSQEVDHGP